MFTSNYLWHRMKKIAYVLAFYILLSSVIPCSLFDNCEKEYTGQATASLPENDCKDCSPFSICSIGHGFTINNENFLADLVVILFTVVHRDVDHTEKPGYYFTYFQPPE